MDDLQVIRENLPDVYEITRDGTTDYNESVADDIEDYPLDVARLLAFIRIPKYLEDYKGWEMSRSEYRDSIDQIFADDEDEEGLVRILKIQSRDDEYAPIMDEFTDQYFETSGVQPASIDECISVERVRNAINRSVHTVGVLRDIASIMSRMNVLSSQLGNDVSTPYDALFTARRLGATTGAISEVYLVEYMSRIPMIMKTTTRNENYQLHEYIVGLRLNELRDTVANFVYTYGYSKVSNPMFNDIGEVPSNPDAEFIAFGLSEASELTSRQVYIEYLQNGTTIADTSRTFSIDVYLRNRDEFPRIDRLFSEDVFEVIFLQLMSALYYAWKRVGFAHRDLNSGNVMLVNLNQLTAVPVMVPISVNAQGETRFARRWLITDVLVVVIDYGYSSIEIPQYRAKYQSRAVSPMSVYGLFESTTTIENDVMNALRYLYRKFGANERDLLDMISLFYTGSSASEDMYSNSKAIIEEMTSLSGGYYIYPEADFFIDRMIIKYCVKYANKWTLSAYNAREFPSVITTTDSTLRPYTGIIRDSRQYYLALMDEDTDYKLDEQSIVNNEWYRRTYVYSSLDDEYKSLQYILWMIKFYKWTNTFPVKLNMEPLTYNEPIDFLRRAYIKAHGSPPDNDRQLDRFLDTVLSTVQ